jgi:hypothetical protein
VRVLPRHVRIARRRAAGRGGGRSYGVLHAGSSRPRDSRAKDLRILELVADRMAPAIERRASSTRCARGGAGCGSSRIGWWSCRRPSAARSPASSTTRSDSCSPGSSCSSRATRGAPAPPLPAGSDAAGGREEPPAPPRRTRGAPRARSRPRRSDPERGAPRATRAGSVPAGESPPAGAAADAAPAIDPMMAVVNDLMGASASCP